MKWLLGLAIVLSACFALAQPARASCAPPEVRRLWSYPAPDARDVPVNAELWVLTSGWSTPRLATLDDRAVDVSTVSFGGIHIAPGPLEPEHAYTLRLEYASAGTAAPTAIEIAFTTAAANVLATAADAPLVLQISTRPGGPRDQLCGDEIQAQDCFDTGQNTLVRFEAVGASAEAWLVQAGGFQVLWPNTCDAPVLFTNQPAEGTCYDVRVIAVGGLVSEPTRRCYDSSSDPNVAPPVMPGDDDAGTPGTTAGDDTGSGLAGSGAVDASSQDAQDAARQRNSGRVPNAQGCRVTGLIDTSSAWAWLLAAGLWLGRRVGRCPWFCRNPRFRR